MSRESVLSWAVRILLSCVVLLTSSVLGCGGDDHPTSPTLGTITIDVEPDSLVAPWTLTGPDGFGQAGEGDRTLSSLIAGDYTLDWGAVSGWTSPTPNPVTQVLRGSGSLTFSGSYVALAGTIEIDPQPSGIDAPWSLTGPSGYTAQGTGDSTMYGLSDGIYTLTWGMVAGRLLPDPPVQTRPLQRPSSSRFTGVYFFEDPPSEQSFSYVAPGTFSMGSPENEPGRFSDETPHTVTLTRGFYMARHEVTEQGWNDVMGLSPTTSQLPKVEVSWDMAVQFCNALSLREGLTPAYTILGANGAVQWNRAANGYRLPTEAEWEYACRAGTTSAFNNSTNCLSADTEANYRGTDPLSGCPSGVYRGEVLAVGSLAPNPWGLYDMHGNAWEWVWDGYRVDYQNLPAIDPVHDVAVGAYRAIRGGSWFNIAQYCRSAVRYEGAPTYTFNIIGFRPVRSAF